VSVRLRPRAPLEYQLIACRTGFAHDGEVDAADVQLRNMLIARAKRFTHSLHRKSAPEDAEVGTRPGDCEHVRLRKAAP